MPFSATDALLGFLLPALCAGAVLAGFLRISRKDAARRFAPSIAYVSGLLLGYFLLKLGPYSPEAHWHWLPYAMLLALVIGPVSLAAGVTSFERVLLYALVAVIAGRLLVPDWEDLKPSPLAHLVFFAIYSTLLASVLESQRRHFSGSLIATVHLIAMAFAAGVLALSGSLRFAQIAGAGAGASAGLALACRFVPKDDSLQGVSLVYVLLLNGILLAGRVNSFSNVPLASYLLIPLAPLSLCLMAQGRLAQWDGAKRTLAGLGLPLIICIFALAIAAVAELS